MIDVVRTKIIGYTMELDFRAKEFDILCDKLDELKKSGIDPNDKRLLEIKKLFVKNNKEILELNKKIYKLQEDEQRVLTNVFEKKEDNQDTSCKLTQEAFLIENRETLFHKIIKKIKKWIWKYK